MENNIRHWKKQYSEIFKVVINHDVYIFRVLNIGEITKVQLLIQEGKIEDADEIVLGAVIYPEDFNPDNIEIPILDKLSEYILDKSNLKDLHDIRQLISDARVNVNKEFDGDFMQWKIAIMKIFPGYKLSDLDNLTTRDFFYLLALAERLIQQPLVNDGTQQKQQKNKRRLRMDITGENDMVANGKKFMSKEDLERIAIDKSTNELNEHFRQHRK